MDLLLCFVTGEKWYRAFLKRHPDIAHRIPEAVSRASGNVSEQDIQKWFHDIKEVLIEENAADALEDPDRVGNADETNFKLCPSKSLVLAEKGSKDVYEIGHGDAKFAVTAMFAYLASGKMVDPMLIFPYQRIPAELVRTVPENWGIGRSESGWMTAETFYEWIGNILGPFLTKNNVKLPFVLFVDGHKTHLTRETSELCKELGIVLIALYPNATHILQPCDVAAFRPLKAAWSKGLLIWRREHPQEALTKLQIAPILKVALEKDMIQTLKNGFRATGLHPFNPDAVNYSKCKGHQEKSVLDVSVQGPEKSINLKDFRRIVGDDVMRELSQDQHPDCKCLAKLALRRLYGTLKADTAVEGERPPPATEAEAGPSHASLPVDLNIVRQEPQSDDDVPDPTGHPEPGPSSAVRAKLQEVLQWPHSPKRKSKRQTERMPYVVTSKRWKDMQDAKDHQRQEQARLKELRTQQRRDRKTEREAEIARKTTASRKRSKCRLLDKSVSSTGD